MRALLPLRTDVDRNRNRLPAATVATNPKGHTPVTGFTNAISAMCSPFTFPTLLPRFVWATERCNYTRKAATTPLSYLYLALARESANGALEFSR